MEYDTEDVCGNCKFWHYPKEVWDSVDCFAECKYNPPVWNDEGQVRSPETDCVDFCSKFEQSNDPERWYLADHGER